MAEYAHPESLVSTDWVAEHGSDVNVRLVEVDVDTSAYDSGHIAGAVGWNWQSQLQATLIRDLVSKEGMEGLLGSAGIDTTTTVILYGDNNNWFAATSTPLSTNRLSTSVSRPILLMNRSVPAVLVPLGNTVSFRPSMIISRMSLFLAMATTVVNGSSARAPKLGNIV